MIAVLLLACGGDGLGNENPDNKPEIAMYHGLEEDARWTYRDDGGLWTDTGFDLDEDQLIRVSHMGEGLVELRRGARWADATPYGSLQWTTTDGLGLVSWDLPLGQGAGEYPMSGALIAVGETVTGEWNCISSAPENGVDTYYALFENAYVFDCSGGGLEGQYVFAFGIGLVSMSIGDNFNLELVAPW